ncbi:MAG: hypothetical protein DRQ55_14525, partial [Planctomycetota bacterium]
MTDSDRARRIEQLFFDALDRASDERAAFLAAACGDDAALRTEVEQLLAADAEAEAGGAATLTPSAAVFSEALEASGKDPWLGRTLGAWTLEALLGEGGMGRVYSARR